MYHRFTVKLKTLTFLEETIGESVCNLVLGKDFLVAV